MGFKHRQSDEAGKAPVFPLGWFSVVFAFLRCFLVVLQGKLTVQGDAVGIDEHCRRLFKIAVSELRVEEPYVLHAALLLVQSLMDCNAEKVGRLLLYMRQPVDLGSCGSPTALLVVYSLGRS